VTLLPRIHGWPTDVQPLALFNKDQLLKAHGAYTHAKAGDEAAALDLLMDVAVAWLYEHRARFVPGLLYVAPHAQEASGDNAIPQALAAMCAAVWGGTAANSIVQSDRVFHTGADAMERMAARAQFVGEVHAGERYVLVDDVTSLGGTLAELANYIQHAGGKIHDVVVLVNAGRNPALVPQPKSVQLLNERFGDEIFNIFGIKPEALTANEAKYLVGFRSTDEIRNRLAAEKQEINHRLRAKGITRPLESAATGLHALQGLSTAGLPAPLSTNMQPPHGA
jgi:orotate phosphoribosyltransferase